MPDWCKQEESAMKDDVQPSKRLSAVEPVMIKLQHGRYPAAIRLQQDLGTYYLQHKPFCLQSLPCERVCFEFSRHDGRSREQDKGMTSSMTTWQLAKRSQHRCSGARSSRLSKLYPATCVPTAVSGSGGRPLPSIGWISGGLRTSPLGHGARLSRSGQELLRR